MHNKRITKLLQLQGGRASVYTFQGVAIRTGGWEQVLASLDLSS